MVPTRSAAMWSVPARPDRDDRALPRPGRSGFRQDLDGIFKKISSNVPLRRVASPAEMGGVCTFLAEEDSAFMTGAVLLLDGGAAIVDVAGTALSDSGMKWGVGGT